MAIQIRRGTNAQWESNNSNIIAGEPVATMDTERLFIGTGAGAFAEFANIGVLANEFSTHKAYIVGELTIYGGKVYKCIKPHEGAWSADDFELVVSLDDGVLSASDYLEIANLLADDYDPTADYFEGQFSKHGGNVYEANQDITAEAWNVSHWNLIGGVS